MATHVLGEIRQECTLCGGSCQGVFVSLLEAETPRIVALAEALGVEEPIVDGRLRREGGRCAFLGEDQLCTIHARFGAEAKPHVCRQYPMVALRVPGGVRVGIDPGCYTHIATWQTAAEVTDTSLVPNHAPISPQDQAVEEALLDVLDPGRLAPALALLTGEPPAPDGGPGPAFSGRLLARLGEADLARFFAREDAAPAMRDGLAPLFALLARAQTPPPWTLSAEDEAYAASAVRRMLFLRLAASAIPMVPAAALLSLSGAVALAWCTEDSAAYGRGLAAWLRAIRIPAIWRAITPDSDTLQWLARG